MYKFDPRGEPVDVTFRVIAADQLGEALADLERHDDDGRSVVHEARRRCKKLRGLLRLVRPAFADYDKESAAIRDAAALLSHLRDAEVLRQTVGGLAEDSGDAVLADIAARLPAAPSVPADDAHLAEFRNRLLAARDRAQHWQLETTGAPVLLKGLRQTYRTAARRMARASRTHAPTDFHDWRKACKYHGFHIDLLKRAAPDLLAAELDLVDRLSTLLGRHHDLTVLHEAADRDPDRFGNATEVVTLRAACDGRRSDIETEALDLGRQIFAERPRSLRRRFAAYWKASI